MTRLPLVSLLVLSLHLPVTPHLSPLTHQERDTDYRSQNFSDLKSRLALAWRGEKSLEETWPSLVRGLRRRLETVRGAGYVPSLHFKHINNNGGHLPAATLDKLRRRE